MKACIVSMGPLPPEARAAAPPGTLFFELTRGLGGAWTQMDGPTERILFGFPESPGRNRLNPLGRRDSFASLALERIIFARGIACIGAADAACLDAVRGGAAKHASVAVIESRPGENPAAFAARIAAEAAK